MDFVPFTKTPKQKRRARITTLGSATLTSGLLSVLPIFIFTGAYGPGSYLPQAVVFIGTLFAPLAGLSVGIPSIFMIPSEMKRIRKSERFEELRAAVGKHYGLTLSASEFAALNYPLDEPTEHFRVYGSIIRLDQVSDTAFVERKIYLVWMDGALKLSSSKDGKRFKELPLARPEFLAVPAQTQRAQLGIVAHSSISA